MSFDTDIQVDEFNLEEYDYSDVYERFEEYEDDDDGWDRVVD